MKRIWSKTKPPKGVLLNAGHPLARGLVGCWLMNEGSGNKIYNLSGNKNTGTLTGMAFPSTTTSGWNPGKFGPALSFDGINDYIAISNFVRPTSQLTISAWTKTTSSAVLQIVSADDIYIGNSQRSWQFRINSGKIDFIVFVGGNPYTTTAGTTNIATGQWYHVTGVYDGEESRVYVNGILEDSDNSMSGSMNGGTGIAIGSLSDEKLDNFFNGKIDEVKIYNRALTATEVNQLYREPFAMFNKESIVLAAIAARIKNFGKFWWKK